ncbi:MAG: c-type cytochrome [Deltaproteobacteria bacterium]|nr:c-type cytochrome [Deltaproteobacteria bacterium]
MFYAPSFSRAQGVRRYGALAVTGLALVVACGSREADHAAAASTTTTTSGGGEGGGDTRLVVVHGPPTGNDPMVARENLKFDGYAVAAGTRGGLTLVGTSLGASEASHAGVLPLPLLGDEPALPASSGAVRAIAPYGDGLLVAADEALLFAKDGALFLSGGHEALHPLGLIGLSSRTADEDDDGALEPHLALRTKGGLIELEDGVLRTWSIPGETGAPSAALVQRDRLFVAYDARLHEIDRATLQTHRVGGELGRITAMACSTLACPPGSVIAIGTDAGLLERGADGRYALYTLAAEGETPLAVRALALDEVSQRLYALAEAGSTAVLVRVLTGARPTLVASIDATQAASTLAVDKTGDVWAFYGGVATRFATGSPLSFASDIAPVFQTYCASCHEKGTNGAPAKDFTDYETAVALGAKVLERLKDGSMPPPGSPPMPKEQLALIAEWLVKMAP